MVHNVEQAEIDKNQTNQFYVRKEFEGFLGLLQKVGVVVEVSVAEFGQNWEIFLQN